MLQPLTQTQARVLDYMAAHIVERQRPPTRKDIATHFGWSSANAAEELLQALERKGHIVMDGAGSHVQRHPRIVCWPASVLPVLRLATPAKVAA